MSSYIPTPAWGDQMLRKEASAAAAHVAAPAAVPAATPASALVGKVEETAPDASGVRTRVEYRRNAETGAVERVTTRIRLVTRQVRASPAMQDRLSWRPFGAAREGNEGTVAVSYDDIHFERPAALGEVEKPSDGLDKLAEGGSALITCRHCGKVGDHYTLKCPYKGMNLGSGTGPTGAAMPEEGAATGSEDKTGKYVPPSARRGADSSAATPVSTDDLTSLRVSNLSEDVEEDELRGLFGHYGGVQRVHIVRDRDTNAAKGFAFVSFYNHGDAERAMKALHGFPFQHLVLRVEWSRPSNKEGGGGGGGLANNAYVTGYGKALPQNRTGK